ncbi:MAG: hypothetical protein COW32_02290 [Candidatus Aquicultor secundus]|uniref:Uncharacterized protein n=3 Tax=Candidatus Aquicultor secundus TaxID=1973895 RepID=A0A2M7T6T7_9ACTN|nr:hypothetical protein [Candidatus Aquicultor secundus]NCO65016.1 hypothetical protein [Solirubrobacter sp.]OIO87793.1 MAG: hypothetical protein AUK32_02995 [Candidatus Aquicultor secundus]PIU26243.1 MAG: hypothetical protein COT10_09675 [Candidatus Aquicultor secundus]PIW22868.1 MAG: hypothetical protein COW32_02290 [Candidatus Aquicultor secundus]PIX52207.1 MAG: hypothetical protein COZ51_05505 [Candidatus Aquicultor secundus]
MIRFENDDNAYLSWLEMNPSGFVVNCERNPKPHYLMLHTASCRHISTSKRSNWTTNEYIKVCSMDMHELKKWAKGRVGGELQPCRCMKSPINPMHRQHSLQMNLPNLNTQNGYSDQIIAAYKQYRIARLDLLAHLELPSSNRDPLAEFSEWLVAFLVGGSLVNSRVQKGYDVIGPEGETIQVKYLANPKGKWVNEHRIYFSQEMDLYALVIFVDLEIAAALIFPKTSIGQVCQALRKRHPDQDVSLQLTQRDFNYITDNLQLFEALGVTDLLFWLPP